MKEFQSQKNPKKTKKQNEEKKNKKQKAKKQNKKTTPLSPVPNNSPLPRLSIFGFFVGPSPFLFGPHAY